MRRTVLGLIAVVLLSAGCSVPTPGGADKSSSPSPSKSTTPTAKTTRTATPTTTPSATPSPTSKPTTGGGRLDVVLADEASVGKKCRPNRPGGVLCFRGSTLRFQPGSVRGVTVASAKAAELPQTAGSWGVTLDFDRRGTKVIADLTKQAMRANEQLVLVLPGRTRVLTAAQVVAPITGGSVQIQGQLTETKARKIVTLITS